MDLIKVKNKVDKDYQLITARYKLSTVEQKLVLSIISMIRPTDTDFMNYQIPVSQFEFLTNNDNARRLKKYCKENESTTKNLKVKEFIRATKYIGLFSVEFIKSKHGCNYLILRKVGKSHH